MGGARGAHPLEGGGGGAARGAAGPPVGLGAPVHELRGPWYTNEDIIYPYSNWRGPVWVVANAMVAYGLLDHGFTESALEVAQRVASAFAGDLRATGTLHRGHHERANATTGEGAGVGTGGAQFISWNTPLYRLLPDVEAAVNPTAV